MSRDPFADLRPLIERVYSYAAYRLGPGPDADDVTSETFERALRYRSSFDAGRGDPGAWLIGIARHCIVDSAVRRELPVDEVPELATTGHEDASLRRLELRAAVARLDERERELVALRYGADFTARQIADLLGLRTNTVEVALHRALARLRLLLDEPAARAETPLRRVAEA
jgi:RNA polymerase sigma-70 factor (ECF subfamily)